LGHEEDEDTTQRPWMTIQVNDSSETINFEKCPVINNKGN
jgi:hypothetical protein